MAFIAIPLVISSFGLGYYFYGDQTEKKDDIPQAPAIEIMEKYNTVVNELKTNAHPILQKFLPPTLSEIQTTRSNLKPVENNELFKKDRSLMDTFVMALKKRRETLNKITI
jgi:hypothetical protein